MLAGRPLGLAAAALALAPAARASRYTPGAGLEVVKIDRPGKGSVNSFLPIGPRSVAIIDGQRTLVETRQVIALARGLGLPVEAIVLTHVAHDPRHSPHATEERSRRRAYRSADPGDRQIARAVAAANDMHRAQRHEAAGRIGEGYRRDGALLLPQADCLVDA